jgi:TPR repeat protein
VEQGDVNARTLLGLIYLEGRGVEPSSVEAHTWFNLAAADGDSEGAKNRDSIAQKMSIVEVLEAQRRAREWRRSHPKPSTPQAIEPR